MKKIYILASLITIVIIFSFSTTKKLYHGPNFSTGITGRTVSGCTCHGPLANPGVTVSLTGLPPNPIMGTTYDLVISVSGANSFAGFDLAADAGTLSEALPADGAQLIGSELTHTTPKALMGGTATWNVRWTADAVGAVNFTFAGNNVNGNGTSSGDFWNIGSLNSTVVLPVILSSFKAFNMENHHKLVWKVEQEINLKQYVIERSCDGIIFESIATMPATDNDNAKEYNYTDATNNCTSEKTFYRLKIEDKDASFEYSPIVTVTTYKKDDLPYVFPNPISKNSRAIKLYVGKNTPLNIQLYNNNGVLLYTTNEMVPYENEIMLPNDLKSGGYYFRISYKSTNKIVRFIVN